MRSSKDRFSVVPGDRTDAERRGGRIGAVLGAMAAALASAALFYWVGSGEDRSITSGPSANAPPPLIAYAPAKPDAGQVVRAFEQLQEIYADQGAPGVVAFARSCAGSLRGDPGMLDFCVAFDIYGSALDSEDPQARDWQAQAGARDLALARSVLPPDQDPAARLGQIRALARQASLEAPAPAAPPVQPATRPQAPPASPSAPPAKAVGPPTHVASRAQAHRQDTLAACRRRATAGQRTVCASPALREADRRLRLTYRRAVDAGVNSRRLAHEQARFRAAVNAAAPDRAAVAKLYHRRTRALEAEIRRAHASAG
jgi:hypothetical protein